MPSAPKGWKVWVEPSGKNWRTRWEGVYGAGQQVFLYKSDAQDLRDALRRDYERRDAGLAPLPRPGAVTLGRLADEYLTYSQAEKAARTYKQFDLPGVSSMRSFIGDAVPIVAIRPGDVQRWKLSLGTKYNGTTSRMYYSVGAALLNYAVRMEYLDRSPAKRISKPPEAGGGRALSEDETTALLTGAPEQLARSGVFSLNTMLRIGEVVKFDWGWVFDVPGGGWAARVPARVRKTARKVVKDCIIPLNSAARAVMGERRAGGRVFPYAANTIQEQVQLRREELGLADDITFHCFRHTGASRYLRNGHLEDLLDTGLWKDVRSLLRYVHVDLRTLGPRFEALSAPLPGP